MGETIRIAICNLQTGIGTTRGYWQYLTTGWKYSLPHGSGPVEKAAEFLRSEEIDVAALCEVEGGSRRSRGVDQVDLITRSTALKESAFFPTFVAGSRINQGNAVCSRFPLRRVHNHALPGAGEPRFLSEAEVRIAGSPVRVLITHLALQLKIRTPQIHHLAEIVHRPGTPTILAGDFNVSHEAELSLLEEGDLRKVISARTFPSWNPTRRLDYLFFSEHFEILSGYPFDRFLFSDHLPFVAEVRMQLDAPGGAL